MPGAACTAIVAAIRSVAQKVLEIAGCDRYCAALINEGGAIHVDGQGTVLVTEQSLLRPQSVADSARRSRRCCKRYLGASCVIWLGEGVIDDETSGHIDNLACFARPGEVCLTWSDDPRDPQQRVSSDAWERLMAARDARGRRLRVHKLPAPGPLHMTRREAAGIHASHAIRGLRAGQRLAGSYVNFYLANGAVILPLLGFAHRRRSAPGAAPRVPAATHRRRAGARDPARRRQSALHYAAAAATRLESAQSHG